MTSGHRRLAARHAVITALIFYKIFCIIKWCDWAVQNMLCGRVFKNLRNQAYHISSLLSDRLGLDNRLRLSLAVNSDRTQRRVMKRLV